VAAGSYPPRLLGVKSFLEATFKVVKNHLQKLPLPSINQGCKLLFRYCRYDRSLNILFCALVRVMANLLEIFLDSSVSEDWAIEISILN